MADTLAEGSLTTAQRKVRGETELRYSHIFEALWTKLKALMQTPKMRTIPGGAPQGPALTEVPEPRGHRQTVQ
ncbi:Hypothetical predicted protein [Pelobates cultripes]|uniref:Uncharacterized protein n=1 Tax=Pelobates cultripes TaxID=61616 RepID=A0AAD1RCS7_PELCU|nr:Hypothetical predicted protein [Pelobates cultripes]